jgi:Lrp/AsnC family leucine-responsive transcriptional regulator
VKLDTKDRQLLFELDFNSRASLSELAKKLRLSKQGVDYKINNLIKKGVIQGFYPVVNVSKLGYLYCRLCMSLKNTTPEIEKEMIEFLKNDNRYFWVFNAQGVYELLVALWLKNVSDFRKAVDDFLVKFGKYVDNKTENINTNVVHYKNKYLINSNSDFKVELKETDERITLDEIDKKILSALCDDARISIVNLAKKLEITMKQASYRIKKLEKQKIMEGYRPIINHTILGLTYYKLWINVEYNNIEKLNELKSYLATNPVVIYYVEGIAFPEDLDIEVMVKDNLELFDFIKELKYKFPGILGNYKSFMFSETKKVRYLPW